MTRKLIAGAACALWLALVAGCVQAPVRVEVRPTLGADFSDAESFAQVPPPWPHPVVGDRVRQEISKVLTERGLTEVPLAEADIAIGYRAKGVRSTRTRTVSDVDTSYRVEEEYIAGTFEIDVFEPKKKAPIWRGIGHIDVVSESSAPAAAAKAVRAILADFPAGTEPAPFWRLSPSEPSEPSD